MAGLTRELPGAEKEAGAGIGKVAPERRTEAGTVEDATGPPVTAEQYTKMYWQRPGAVRTW